MTDDAAATGEVVADLHVHTTASDGRLTLSKLPDAARDAGLEWVAVTDHDRLHPELAAPVTVRDGVTVVRGIELRVEADTQRLDLLGYAVRETPALVAALDRLQRNRIERARAIVDCLADRLGVELDVDVRAGVGRPHIARAVADSAAPYDYQGAFDHLIGDGGPCYVSRDLLSFERGAALLADAAAVVALAHPFRYPDPDAALACATALDAVERNYPYDDAAVALARVDAVADRHGLLVTGGSDAHDCTLGAAGLDRAGLAAVRDRLPGAER